VLSREAIASLGLDAATMDGMQFYKPHGCDACGQTGFRGRIALFELLEMDEEISRLILVRAEAREVQRAAVDAGMRLMLADGIAKAQVGLTTVEEILRVTREA
jgi:general secretion pathway protein E